MGASYTVMTTEQIVDALWDDSYKFGYPMEANELSGKNIIRVIVTSNLFTPYRILAKAQAEISFKAGIREMLHLIQQYPDYDRGGIWIPEMDFKGMRNAACGAD